VAGERVSIAGLARISAQRPWRVVAVWVVLLITAVVLQGVLPSGLTSEATFTNNPESVQGQDLLTERLRGPDPVNETIVVTSDTLTIDDAAFQAGVRETTLAVRDLSGIAAAVNYFDAVALAAPHAEGLVAADRHSTLIQVTFAGDFDDALKHEDAYMRLIEARNSAVPGVRVLTVGSISGDAIYGAIAAHDLERAELFGLPVALLILVIVFGALIAAGVPLLTAMLAIAIAFGVASIVGQMFKLSALALNVITMIGLAVGIDYCLFIVQRFREERTRGLDKLAAIGAAGGSATKAVIFSGSTVVIALTGMFLLPVSIFRSIAAGAIIVVIVSMLASLTFVPALLSLLGDRLDWPRRRKATAPHDIDDTHGFWGRLAHLVMARPVVSVVLAGGLLLAAATPYLDLRTGQVGIEGLPPSQVKSAYEILARDFYAGVISPVEIVVVGDTTSPAVQRGIDAALVSLAARADFGPADVVVNQSGDLTLISAPLAIDANSPAAGDIIAELRSELLPQALAGAPARVYVTGDAAYNHDFNTLMRDSMPTVFAFVLGLSFILLLIAFRSIVVPLKAILMNLLSVGAAYGALVLVFQKGVGTDLLGFQPSPTIATWLPITLFCFLFGLSMDYHVFLLSRIREQYDKTHDNRLAVAYGLQSTARIITGAALIMVAVFSAFAAGRLIELQQMGFGLAIAVFLDATIVRTVLVPSTMALLGDLNWYLPRWLQWLPDLRVKHSHAA
jgi:putative drug exporter of the RND superfamily